MTTINDSRRFGRVSPLRLAWFELRHRLKLPDSYRSFLLEHNGGRPDPDCVNFTENGKRTQTDVQYLYGLHDGEYWAKLSWSMRSLKGRIVEGSIPIANDSCGNFFLLVFKGPKSGEIFFWDHEQESKEPDFSNMSFVAHSFKDFIDGLTVLDPEI